MNFSRYAIYYIPEQPLFQLGSDWLGWNSLTGSEIPLSDDQRGITKRPRKYGFHATIKPPFVLSPDHTQDDLKTEFKSFCQSTSPATGGNLKISRLGRFLAITQDHPASDVTAFAAAAVTHFDKFCAPLSEDAIAKRRQSKLSPQQDMLMLRWGYPYVMQEFKFHMTLTGPLKNTDIDPIDDRANAVFHDHLSKPLGINALALLGEDTDSGHFHVIEHKALETKSPA